MNIELSSKMMTLLREVAIKHQIDLQPFITEDGNLNITDRDREIMIGIISTEFSATGLRPDSEPNPRELELEELLDRVNKLQ